VRAPASASPRGPREFEEGEVRAVRLLKKPFPDDAGHGYSRDGKKGKLQIEYGLLTDPEGRPIAIGGVPR